MIDARDRRWENPKFRFNLDCFETSGRPRVASDCTTFCKIPREISFSFFSFLIKKQQSQPRPLLSLHSNALPCNIF